MMGHVAFDTAIASEMVGVLDLLQPCRPAGICRVAPDARRIRQLRGRDIRIVRMPAGGRVTGLAANSTVFVPREFVSHVAVTLITGLCPGECRVSRGNLFKSGAAIVSVLSK